MDRLTRKLKKGGYSANRHPEAELQERLDQLAPGVGLADGHDSGSRSGGSSQGTEHDGEGKIQPQYKIADQENQQSSAAGFHHGNDKNFSAVFLQGGNLEEFPGAKGDESQGDIRQERGFFDHFSGQQIQAEGARQNAADNIRGDVGQSQQLCDSCHQKADCQHQGNGDNGDGNGGLIGNPVHPNRHRLVSFHRLKNKKNIRSKACPVFRSSAIYYTPERPIWLPQKVKFRLSG